MKNLFNARLAITAVAAATVAAAGCASTATTQQHHLLWKVESPTNTVYLLGSVHILDSASYPLPPVMESAFMDADALVLELNLDSAMSGAMLMMANRGVYTDGRTLKSVLPEKTYSLLADRMADLGLSMAFVDRMKPWLAGFMLMSQEVQGGNFDAQHGIDMYFDHKAEKRGIPRLGLETAADQFNAFDGMSDAEQSQFLYYMLTDTTSDSGSSLDSTIAAWKAGDTQKLQQVLTSGFADQPVLYQRLVVDRNRRWVPEIERLLKDSRNYMVVVGALHLVGDDSVIQMLRAMGYRVEQL